VIFGGEPPKNIEDVLSWDKDRLLIGGGSFWYLDFVERGETSEFRDVDNTMERRAALARKAYSARLRDVYRHLRGHNTPLALAHPGGITLMEQTIGAYFAMIQAERDAEAGRAVEGETIDKLIAAQPAKKPIMKPRRRLSRKAMSRTRPAARSVRN
jgi:hypothetical protein